MIKAPYNFIPLPDTVILLDWASKISQDIPFSDGISGTISLSLTAKSPIFVRNGHSQDDAKNKNETFSTFSNIDGQYFLPATTVKGAIRNVLEILSFGKMRLDKNARFAQREWDNTTLYPIKGQQNTLRCGWLKIKEDGSCEIIDCGRPRRIGQGRLDSYLEQENFSKIFTPQFSNPVTNNLTDKRKINEEEIDPKTAYYKYRLIENSASVDILCDLTFSQDEEYTNRYNQSRVIVDENGDLEGTIVLTGQPDPWKDPRPRVQDPNAGKYYEFVFPTPPSNARRYPLTEDEFNQYRFIYADSLDWKYLNEEKPYGDKGIPVFFRKDNTNKLIDWGLSYLYKLPYQKTPLQTLPDQHMGLENDMAECLFGFVGSGVDSSLKGRVQFSHFMSDKVKGDIVGNPDDKVHLILSSPKASYYPAYIQQSGTRGRLTGNYKTYNDGIINGWKRYLRRNAVYGSVERNDDQTENDSNKDSIITTITPLNDVVFNGSIRFHNLRPEELGALLSALTFHGHQENCFHLIGMAKPYGYGKVKLEITGTKFYSAGCVGDNDLMDSSSYMAIFEKFMNDKIHMTWTNTPTVKELLTISRFDIPNDLDLTYMTLNMEGTNDFDIAKTGRWYLKKYSEIIGTTVEANSLVDKCPSASTRLNEQRERHKEEYERIKDEQDAAEKRRIQEEEEARAIREAEKLRQAEEQRRQAEAEAQAARIATGLSMLEEKYLDKDEYKTKDFKSARNKIETYLKSLGDEKIPENQCPVLHDTLLRLAASPSRDEKKQKAWSKRDSQIWRFLEQKVSKEFADSVFKEVNS